MENLFIDRELEIPATLGGAISFRLRGFRYPGSVFQNDLICDSDIYIELPASVPEMVCVYVFLNKKLPVTVWFLKRNSSFESFGYRPELCGIAAVKTAFVLIDQSATEIRVGDRN